MFANACLLGLDVAFPKNLAEAQQSLLDLRLRKDSRPPLPLPQRLWYPAVAVTLYPLIRLKFRRGTYSQKFARRRRNRIIRLATAGDIRWTVPDNYNWEVCTQENYAAAEMGIGGPLDEVRKLVDIGYHGFYSQERQKFQDALVLQLLEGRGRPRKRPMLLFTAGAMGVGKTYVVEWLSEKGYLPLDEFVIINPDTMAQQLPEWKGYDDRAHISASMMTRLEAGLLTELSLVHAVQQRRNILVDSSLRHGSWYALVLERLRKELPDVYVILMYVHTTEETIRQRAEQRGVDGRAVSVSEVGDSLQKMPLAIGRLLPQVDHFIQVANDGDTPKVTSVCNPHADFQSEEEHPLDRTFGSTYTNEEDEGGYCEIIDSGFFEEKAPDLGWARLRSLFSIARGGDPDKPLKEPPRILPKSSNEESQPLLQLLRTIVYAGKKHQHQCRKDSQRTPYINHPLAVARILAEVGIRDLRTLQAALLHDTLEDTDATGAEIDTKFGKEVLELVQALTDDDSLRPTTRKLAQLRGVKSLPLKAKLVRIADKLHNVWDIMHHGIPGWSASRKSQYIAWAVEMVSALEGTHKGLEDRFHDEVSLPPGYKLGDWERIAIQKEFEVLGSFDWEHIEDLPKPEPHQVESTAADLSQQKGVLSLLKAAEFASQRGGQGSVARTLRSFRLTRLMAFKGVRDHETLQAALLFPGPGNFFEKDVVAREFGREVDMILASLHSDVSASMPFKAKQILLAHHLLALRDQQVLGLDSLEAEDAFVAKVEEARIIRQLLKGCHSRLELNLDEVLNGQVRLASGELVSVDAMRRNRLATPVSQGYFAKV